MILLIFRRINLLIPFELSLSVAEITWLQNNFKFIFLWTVHWLLLPEWQLIWWLKFSGTNNGTTWYVYPFSLMGLWPTWYVYPFSLMGLWPKLLAPSTTLQVGCMCSNYKPLVSLLGFVFFILGQMWVNQASQYLEKVCLYRWNIDGMI